MIMAIQMASDKPAEASPEKAGSNELRPGKTALRWLLDFYEGRVGDFCDPDDGKALGDLFVPCKRSTLPCFLGFSGLNEGKGHHELLIIETQSVSSKQISCICRFCKYHFLFRFDHDGAKTCPWRNPQGPSHHLVRAGIDAGVPRVEDVVEEKFFPLTSAAMWRCSSVHCTFKVMVYMTRPRLSMEHLMVVANPDRIEKQRAEAVRQDPERFKDLAPNITETALMTLNAYLRDITNEKPADAPKIKIAARNKRFMVQFGEPCSNFFEYLGFEKTDLDGEIYWLLPKLQHYPNHKTPIGSQRAFFEDVRSEVQALLEAADSNAQAKEVAPVLAHNRLTQALDPTGSPLSVPATDNLSYRKLGIVPNCDDGTVQYAYQTQVAMDPGRKAEYLNALQDTASQRGPDLQVFAASQASLADAQNLIKKSTETPLAAAFHHFGLDSSELISDGFILQKHKVLCESSPAQAGEHHQKLAIIARSRKSSTIMKEACLNLSFAASCQILGLDHDALKDMSTVPDADTVAAYADIAVNERKGDLYIVAAALDVIADTFDPVRDQLYKKANGYRQKDKSLEVDFPDLAEPENLNMPLGLQNLRNTCYMNSILQYFYTVTPVRELVESYNPNSTQEQAFPELMTAEQAEVYVGQELLKSLGHLFVELKFAKGKDVKPLQQLANAASLSIAKVAEQTEKDNKASAANANATPPPLPARPGTNQDKKTNVAPIETTVTVAPVPTESGVSTPASIASSQTLIDHPMEDSVQEVTPADVHDDDVEVVERIVDSTPDVVEVDADGKEFTTAPAAAPSPATPASAQMVSKEKIDAILNQKMVQGTDQMDVEEIMGRFLGYIRAAINPKSVKNPSDPDIIFDTFYTKIVEVSKDEEKAVYTRKPSVSRWITAWPAPEGEVSLYEALDTFFDQEALDTSKGGLLRHLAIQEAPPILHICFQRSISQYRKNSNAVEIPAELYLDRYMDAEEDSALFHARKRGWNIKAELEELKKTAARSANPTVPAASPTKPDLVEEGSLGFDDDGADDSDFVVVEDDISDAEVVVVEEMEDEEMEDLSVGGVGTLSEANSRPLANPEELKTELAGLFSGLTTHKYRLHAVICHAGQMGSGHYWVWIFDFGAGVWRKYNDTTVTERSVADVAAVLEELSSKGEPYYVAYVRDQDKDDFVQVPPRVLDGSAPPAPVVVYDWELPSIEG